MENNILWEEKNLIEREKNCSNNLESEQKDFTTNTKTDLTKNQCNDTGKEKITCLWCNSEFFIKPSKTNIRKFCNIKCSTLFRNKDKCKFDKKIYYNNWKLKNINYHKEYNKKYYIRKKPCKMTTDEIKLKRRNYFKNKMKSDVLFKLKHTLRNRLNNALRQNHKSGSAVNDLGCSIEEFKNYIQSKFKDGMNWKNQGEWHIDHIKPLSSFDLTDRNQLLEACHYTNLQPLWAIENLKKSDSFTSIL